MATIAATVADQLPVVAPRETEAVRFPPSKSYERVNASTSRQNYELLEDSALFQ
jgi:hypothetical protein